MDMTADSKRLERLAAAWVLVTGAVALSLAAAPLAGAYPTPGAGSASDAIAELQNEGYDVEINWLEGHPNVPLAECRVDEIHDPNTLPLSTTTLNTVYVDVQCPNAK
jgi:hypothetical protein